MNYSEFKYFKKNGILKYNKYIKPFIFELITTFLFIIIFTLSNLVYPYFLKMIIDDALVEKNIHKLFFYTLGMIITLLIMVISRYLVSDKSLKVCQKVTLKIKSNILEQITKYSEMFFKKYKNAEITSIIENDLQHVQRIGMYIITEFLVSIITIIGLLLIIFTINLYIGLLCIFLLIIYAYLQKKNGKKIKNYSLKLSKYKGELYSHTQEFISNLSDIKMLNYHNKYKDNYIYRCIEYFKLEKNIVNLGVFSNIIGIIFNNLALILILCLGGYIMLQKNMTMGMLFTLTIYVQQLFSPIITLTNLYIEIKKLQASLKRISNLLNNNDYIIHTGYIDSDNSLYGDISLTDFSFKYENKIIFDKSNMKINPKSKIGIIGDNGSGKTTLMKILMRLQKNYKGKITIDGYNIENYKLDYLRRNIICISQNSFIFSGTILENITLNNNNVSREKIEEIIDLVCLRKDIDDMKNGINTIVGNNEICLSGGQVQKIALARIFLTDCPIILLDEPTSALDTKSEKIICNNIYTHLYDKTIISITHRKEILKYCENIYELSNKKIIKSENIINI